MSFDAMYRTVSHFSGNSIVNIDVTSRLPWLYIIAAVGDKLVYIGETYDESGLITRLSSHFGRFTGSTLKKNSMKLMGIKEPKSPFVVFGARIPFSTQRINFDGTSKQVRLLMESYIHELVARGFVAEREGWSIVSTVSGNSRLSLTSEIQIACESIYRCFCNASEFLEPIATASPFQFVMLDYDQPNNEENYDTGQYIEYVELSLFEWVISSLKKNFADSWWVDGIKQDIRVACASKRESEKGGQSLPPEAYMTLIDLRAVIQKNWSLFSNDMEEISGLRGKDAATKWLVELNETRKQWAHPIKQKYLPIEPARKDEVRVLYESVKKLLIMQTN